MFGFDDGQERRFVFTHPIVMPPTQGSHYNFIPFDFDQRFITVITVEVIDGNQTQFQAMSFIMNPYLTSLVGLPILPLWISNDSKKKSHKNE